MTITPDANQSGAATITVTVSDGSLTATGTFILTVNAVVDTDEDGIPDTDRVYPELVEGMRSRVSLS